MKKDTVIGLVIWIPIIAFVVFTYFKNNSKEFSASPIQNRYELNILAKKHEIPLPIAKKILVIEKIRDSKGSVNWAATIEGISKEAGIPEKVTSAFLVDAALIYNYSGDYDDQNRE